MPDSPPLETPSASGLPADFLALLCCPVCGERPPLRYEPSLTTGDEGKLICDRCGRHYPIVEGLPDLRPQDGVSDAPAPAAGTL